MMIWNMLIPRHLIIAIVDILPATVCACSASIASAETSATLDAAAA